MRRDIDDVRDDPEPGARHPSASSEHRPGGEGETHPSAASGAERAGRGVSAREEREALPRDRPGRERGRSLTPTAERTLIEIGMFRAVTVNDLIVHRYGGDRVQAVQDLSQLARRGLVIQHQITVPPGPALHVMVLTEPGRAWATQRTAPGLEQAVYAGLVKSRELAHNVALYRLYQVEAARLARTGARIRRVVLDAELKQPVASRLARVPRTATTERARERAAVAEAHGLRVIEGKVVFPDLRIEYDTPAGDRARVDVELATPHYSRAQLIAKVQAGFTIYVAGRASARMTALFDEREITAAILSL